MIYADQWGIHWLLLTMPWIGTQQTFQCILFSIIIPLRAAQKYIILYLYSTEPKTI